MPSYVFQTILKKGEKQGIVPSMEKRSIDWFRNTAKTTVANPNTLIMSQRERLRKLPELGKMYLFAYIPKHKATLPYYDIFPLVIPFDAVRTNGRAGDSLGFMGMNLHYLPFQLRARLMNNLYNYLSNEKMDDTTRIKVSYRFLKRTSELRFFKPCIKQYLFSHMRSRFFYIQPNEWDMAMALPLQRFFGAQEKTIYKESREKI